VPWRDRTVEDSLVGEVASTDLFESAAARLTATARGAGHNDFKIPLVQRVLVAVLEGLTASGA
jgi:xanthine dehydrogenase YagS FAD-binding subunit